MKIIRDTREQRGYDFAGCPFAEVIPGTLNAGDYSLHGFTDCIAVERKELGDLLGCLTHDRERFTRELERLRGYQSAALLIEAPLSAIAAGRYRSAMTPEAAVQSLISFMANFKIPVFFADSREAAEGFCFHFLRHFFLHAQRRYKAIAEQSGAAGNE